MPMDYITVDHSKVYFS